LADPFEAEVAAAKPVAAAQVPKPVAKVVTPSAVKEDKPKEAQKVQLKGHKHHKKHGHKKHHKKEQKKVD
jgi:hypothetical protein